MAPQSRLERYQQGTEWPLIAVALAFLAMYSVRVLNNPHGEATKVMEYILLAIFFAFIVDYIVRLWLVQPRGGWFLRHLRELPILLLPFLRSLRLLSLAVVINALQRAVGHTIRGRVIIYTVCGAVLIVYAASLAIIDIEADHPDANISDFGDALWRSITTVTTGYNDLVPLTAEGRIVAVVLMIGGISLIGIVTAQIHELREEIRRLAQSVNGGGGGVTGERVEGRG